MSPTIIQQPKTIISSKLLDEVNALVADAGQVVIHGLCLAQDEPIFLRIWPTTFLFDHHSSHISELVYFEKISGFPQWTQVPAHTEYAFTLVFSGLPKTCILFDLQEVIPQSDGFYIPSISRNEKDVYYLDFSGR